MRSPSGQLYPTLSFYIHLAYVRVRFFELGGIVYCGGRGKKMLYYASVSEGRMYPYYKCRRVTRDGKDACPAGQYP